MKTNRIQKHLLVLNVVGLSPKHVGENTPNLQALAKDGVKSYIQPQLPAVTSSVQATYMTGSAPSDHGIVANGWYMKDLAEVRFWHQSNHLLGGSQIWSELKNINAEMTSANLFWWYNMYCPADYAVTVRPMYPADGRKIPDIYTTPSHLRPHLNGKLGQFPLFHFWGPFSGIVSSQWIGSAGEFILKEKQPNLTMIYLPHLDYSLQKLGPDHPSIAKELQEIDDVCGKLIAIARDMQAEVVVLSEYGISAVNNPIHINRIFREQGWLKVREELGLELLDAGASDVFAVADHQVAHIYVKNKQLTERVLAVLANFEGIETILDNDGKHKHGLNHHRSGDLVAFADSKSWFTYYYWLDKTNAPDFARTVDIHRKPGYDPVELFIDPSIQFPKLKLTMKLLKKKLGFRTLMDVIPTDAHLVKGSHGSLPQSAQDGAIFLCSRNDSLREHQKNNGVVATEVKDLLLSLLQ